MKRHLACVLACVALALALSGICSGQDMTEIIPIKDAPFSAEFHKTYTTSAHSSERVTYVARSGNGSVYFAYSSGAGITAFKDRINSITFEDAPSDCSVRIHPFFEHVQKTESGKVTGASRESSFISLAMRTHDDRPGYSSVDAIRKSHRTAPQCRLDNTLGERVVDGMVIFGSHWEYDRNSELRSVEEDWSSELGFPYSRREVFASTGNVRSLNATSIKLGEPDPELFTVQDKYLPPTTIFSKASTVTVSYSGVDEDLARRIESILTASGRYAIVPDSKAADLLIQAKQSHTEHASQITLIIYKQGKVPRENPHEITRIGIRLPEAPEQRAESPVINTCFANVWRRLENVKAPSQPSDDPFLNDLQ